MMYGPFRLMTDDGATAGEKESPRPKRRGAVSLLEEPTPMTLVRHLRIGTPGQFGALACLADAGGAGPVRQAEMPLAPASTTQFHCSLPEICTSFA